MDRWYWYNSKNFEDIVIKSAVGIRLYDGDKRSDFEDGTLKITNFRLIWSHSDGKNLALDLNLVILIEDEQGGLMSSPKIILHLMHPLKFDNSRPFTQSRHNFVKISFRQGGITSFKKVLDSIIADKPWQKVTTGGNPVLSRNRKVVRTGILGIERDIEAKQKKTDSNINLAFEDLKNLIDLAKDMVTLSKSIANKIKEKSGEISSDETVQLRSYLLSLGIDDPVTKEAVGSTTEYHKLLANEICTLLQNSIDEVGGVMLLSEVYCRINRARGLHLVSPEDVFNACSLMRDLKMPLKLHKFQSGVFVLELCSLDEESVSKTLLDYLNNNKSDGISAIEFSSVSGMPLLLAQERLYHAENVAAAVRDESEEGLRFFPNLFLTTELKVE